MPKLTGMKGIDKAAFAMAAVFLLAMPLSRGAGTKQSPASRPVVLVHGYMDDSSKMQWMADAMRDQGFTVFTPSLTPSHGEVSQEELAKKLAAYIDAHIPHGEKFDLVAFSMGGVVCRYYLQRMGGMRRVDHFVTLGTPNHGTLLACLSQSPGCLELRPGSDFLNDLNSDAGTLSKVKYTSIWTPFDTIIVPSESSRMPVGQNIRIWVPIHPLLVWSPKSVRTVTGILRS
ncbi:MAG TPA: triacylglycerol lipase [Chthoniobacteraceae bacterium]|nr:triacylglycerol lipase [Chthoniobacteraceae bacterium]